MNKTATLVAVAALAAAGYHYNQAGSAPASPQRSASLAPTPAPPEIGRPGLSPRALQLLAIYRDACADAVLQSDPYAAQRAVYSAMAAGDSSVDMAWLMPNVVPTELIAQAPQFRDRNPGGFAGQIGTRQIVSTDIPSSPTEHAIATIRYTESPNPMTMADVWLFEDGIWKVMIEGLPEAFLLQALDGMGVQVADGRVVNFGNYADTMQAMFGAPAAPHQ